MSMRMTPPTRQTHRHPLFLLLLPTIIALFLCSAGAYAFTHPITATTLRLSSLLSLSPHYAPPPPSPSTSSLPSLKQNDEKLHRYNRRGRASRLVVALSSSSSSSSESLSTSDNNIIPETFREGEIIGLRYMQDGRHEEALKGERWYRYIHRHIGECSRVDTFLPNEFYVLFRMRILVTCHMYYIHPTHSLIFYLQHLFRSLRSTSNLPKPTK